MHDQPNSDLSKCPVLKDMTKKLNDLDDDKKVVCALMIASTAIEFVAYECADRGHPHTTQNLIEVAARLANWAEDDFH